MDVGFYLSELLMQYSEVSVPGLGSFVRARMSAYYDDSEGRFYPPYHQVQFYVLAIDDDGVLTEYIARKKNISIASATYFIEKYIAGLRQEAANGEIAVAGLGSFHIEMDQLVFKPALRITADAGFYGYEPVTIKKAVHDAVVSYPDLEFKQQPKEKKIEEPEKEEFIPYEKVIIQDNEMDPAYFVVQEEEEQRKPRNMTLTWLVVLISAGVLFALYRYNSVTINSALFGKSHTISTPVTVKPAVTIPVKDSIKADTIKPVVKNAVQQPVKDTVAAKQLAPDTVKKARYEVIATSFKTENMAQKTIKNFKTIGVDAHIVRDAPGRLLKISVGTYANRKDAEAARIKLVAAGKIQKDAFSIEIKPKQ